MSLDLSKLAVVKDYVLRYGEMGSKSNSMDRLADVNALFARASLAVPM